MQIITTISELYMIPDKLEQFPGNWKKYEGHIDFENPNYVDPKKKEDEESDNGEVSE
jgi:hypothetical protein